MGTIVGRGRRASQDEEDKSKILSHLLLNFDMFSLWTYIFDVHIILTFKSYHGIQSLHYHNGGRVTTIISNICRKKTPFLLGMGEGGTQINFDTFFKSAKVSQFACTRIPPCQNWIDTFCKSCPNCVQVGGGPPAQIDFETFYRWNQLPNLRAGRGGGMLLIKRGPKY